MKQHRTIMLFVILTLISIISLSVWFVQNRSQAAKDKNVLLDLVTIGEDLLAAICQFKERQGRFPSQDEFQKLCGENGKGWTYYGEKGYLVLGTSPKLASYTVKPTVGFDENEWAWYFEEFTYFGKYRRIKIAESTVRKEVYKEPESGENGKERPANRR